MVPNPGIGRAAVTALIGAAAFAASVLIGATPARAMSSCTGTYAAGLLHPVPPRVVIGLDIFDNSDRNIELGKRFMEGVASVGVATSGTPTALLRLSTQFSRSGDSADANAGNSRPPRPSFGDVGNIPSPPKFGSSDLQPQPPDGGENSVIMQAQLVNPTDETVLWIASIHCVRQTTDDGALAYDLGRLIGRSLGKRVERGPV